MPPFGVHEETIRCEDCGTEVQAKRKNQKYCSVCRLIRNIQFIGGKKKVCVCCEGKFAPLTVNDMLCPECDIVTPNTEVAECAFCPRTTNLIRDGIRVCRYCAYDPARRQDFYAALTKRRKTQLEATV